MQSLKNQLNQQKQIQINQIELNKDIKVFKEQLKGLESKNAQLSEANESLKSQVSQLKLLNLSQKTEHEQEMKGLKAYRKQMEKKFNEFDKLCKEDMNETMKSLMNLAQNESIDEQLRKDIIEQGRQYVHIFKTTANIQSKMRRSSEASLKKT